VSEDDGTMATTSADDRPAERSGGMLDTIERLGNKVPHPAIIFLALCGLVIVLSHVLYLFDISVTSEIVEEVPVVVDREGLGGSDYPELVPPADSYYEHEYEVVTETVTIESLLTADGVRFLFSSFVSNFASFSVVAVVLVAMIGVGVAEGAGMMNALIRKMVAVTPPGALTFAIVLLGIISSVATDAGYLILIPLGAAAFLSVGRHPLAGLAAAYAGVSAGFGVNVLISPMDGLITEVTNEAVALVDTSISLDLTANIFFGIGSTFFLALVMTFISERLVERRLGTYDPHEADDADDDAAADDAAVDPPAADHSDGDEAAGLKWAFRAFLGTAVAIGLLTVLPDAPLRNPSTGSIIEDSPFMASLIFIITLLFLAAGIGYGFGAKTFSTSVDVINSITTAFAGLSGLIFLLLLISQFIAYFNFSNMPTVAAVKMADLLESADVGALWLLIGLILVTMILNIIIPGVVPKWAIFAPIFVPLFVRLGVAPQTVLAAYRVGDSPTNVITPLMVYLPLIVLTAQKYRKGAGVGTVVSLMLPYTILVALAWTAFFALWYLLGIPLGPGSPVEVG
jgi:aminobenzoyl-glutamate transport protein